MVMEGYSEDRLQCPKGFSCVTIQAAGVVLVINGLITAETRANFSGDRLRAYKAYRLEDQDVVAIRRAISAVHTVVEERKDVQVRDSVSFLHEVRTSVGIVLSWCEELVDRQVGDSFEEKLVSADNTTRNLLNSINLLSEQLNLIDIIVNPEAITYGKQYDSSIHGFILKMVKLFEPLAARRGVNIALRGKTYAEIRSYQSFQYVPLVLLDNAIKYCHPNSTITVTLSEAQGKVTFSVGSNGPIVPKDERERIFEKYHRCKYAERASAKGMGMGLHLARNIARAHGTDVCYHAIPDEGATGTSTFSVTMDKVD